LNINYNTKLLLLNIIIIEKNIIIEHFEQ